MSDNGSCVQLNYYYTARDLDTYVGDKNKYNNKKIDRYGFYDRTKL